jgi:phospholipid/cholesterol/gamma-HCH transport system permease protein
MGFIYHLGRYWMMLVATLGRPEKLSVFWKRFMDEVMRLGISSMGIVFIISLFMGAVITLQTAYNIDSPWIPKYTIGFTARQTVILEFSPTILALILAGKVGSNIASELGTMRVTEQIDALEIMGINSREFLILPKIVGAMFIFPILVIYSMALGIIGGWLIGVATGEFTTDTYIYGITYFFDPYSIQYALTKTVVFAFVITSVSAYHGYYTKGGALEVGKSSTKAVVYSSIIILLTNYLITQLLLG